MHEMRWSLLTLLLISACTRDVLLGTLVPPAEVMQLDDPAATVAPTGAMGPTTATGPTGPTCVPEPAEICDDGRDNDCNGFFDEQEPNGACDSFLLHRVSPVLVSTQVVHAAAVNLDVRIVPPDVSFATAAPIARAWSVLSAAGGVTCGVSDLIEDAMNNDSVDHLSRTLRLATANDPARMGCSYEIEVTIGPRSRTRFSVTFVNGDLTLFEVSPTVQLGALYEAWLPADTGGLIFLNASDQDGDVPYTFRLLDLSGLTACNPSCEVVGDTNAGFAMPGPLVAGDYMMRVDVSDAVSTTPQRGADVLVHVVDCAWALLGGAGSQDGSSPANALPSLSAAIAANDSVCILGSDTYAEDLTLASTTMLGGFDSLGAVSFVDRPTIALQTGAAVVTSGSSALLRTVQLTPATGASGTVSVIDASLVLDDVWLRVPDAAGALGVNLSGLTQTSALTVSRSATRFVTAGDGAKVFSVNASGAAARLVVDRSSFEISPCAGACAIVETVGPAEVFVSKMGLEFSASDATALRLGPGVPTIDLRGNSGWNVSATNTARLIHAPSGANVTARNNNLGANAMGSAISFAVGLTGSVTIENNDLGANAENGEAIAIDLTGTTNVRIANNSIKASATYFGAAVATSAVAIRLSQTTGTHIVNNERISITQSGTARSIAILDGAIDRQGVRTAGGSTDLLIEGNARIAGGNGLDGPTPQDCSVDPSPETADIGAGIVLIGSVRPVVRGNGRPQERGSGVAGGSTRPYWNAATRRLPPIVAGVWLIETDSAAIENNELRGGEVVPLPDAACAAPSEVPATIALLDGLMANGGSVAEGGSIALRVSGNGIDCAAPASGTLREPARCEAVVLAATDAVLENNFIGASEGASLLDVRAQGGGVVLLHNFLSLDVVSDGVPAPTGRLYEKRGIVAEAGVAMDVVGNIFRITQDDQCTLVLFSGVSSWIGNLVDSDVPLDPASAASLAASQANREARARYLDFGSVWQRSLSRMPATSDALNFAPRGAVFSATDIDGQTRDATPDAGPDELVR